MRRLGRLAAAAAIVAAVVPEPLHWAAERTLYRATAALQIVARDPSQAPDRARALEWIERLAVAVARRPGADHRPWMVAGSARLLAGRPADAAAHYVRALAGGERAEIDLGLGRAAAARGRREEAQAWLLRAAWISPALAGTLPEPVRGALLAEVARLEAELRAGRLASSPPRPAASAP